MTSVGKLLTLAFMGAMAVLIITHPAGFAGDATAGGSVLNNTLALESGKGSSGGTVGTVNGMTFG
jgi:hypothetical protein